MQAPALGAGQRLVRHLADQDVAKGKDIGSRRAEEILVDEPVDHLVDTFESWFQREEAGCSESASKHGAKLDDSPLLRSEQVEARQHGGLNRIRKLVRAGMLGDRAD